MSHQNPVTRTCTACGIEKPLNAFLQLSEKHGTVYGTICATCRMEGKTAEPAQKQLEDESTTIPTGARIGAKEKIYAEEDSKRKLKDLKELYRKEQRVIDDKAELKTEKALQKEKDEKLHRETYIEERKKRGFLSQQRVTTVQTQRTFQITPENNQQEQSLLEENKQQDNKQQELTQTQNTTQQDNQQQELNATFTPNNAPFLDPQSGEVRYNKLPLKNIKNWLGTQTPNVNSLDQLYKKTIQQQSLEKNTQQTDATFKNKKLLDQKFIDLKKREFKLREQKDKSAKDPVIDYIEKNWGPSSRKR